MLSVRPSVRPFSRSSVNKLVNVNTIFWKQMNRWCRLTQVVAEQDLKRSTLGSGDQRSWSLTSWPWRMQIVKGQSHARSKIDLKVWRRHGSRPPWSNGFLSRISTTVLTRDIVIAVPPVCHAPLLCQNGLTYQPAFSAYCSPIILVFPILNIFAKYWWCHPIWGR